MKEGESVDSAAELISAIHGGRAEDWATVLTEPIRVLLRTHIDDLGSQFHPGAEVLLRRYGYTDGCSHTLQAIGSERGVTREQVRKIEAKALRRLRHPQYVHPLKTAFGVSPCHSLKSWFEEETR